MKFCARGLAALLALAVVAAGCAPSGDRITFLHWRGEDRQVFADLIDQFTRETGIVVEQQVLPSDQYTAQAGATLLSGVGGDVFATMPGAQFAQLSEAGFYVDLSDASFRDRFEPQYIERGAVDGRQLTYPYQLVFNIPVYNRELFEQAGVSEPPQDWQGFLAACDRLKAVGVAPILFAGNVSPSQFINPMVMNNQPDPRIWDRVEVGQAAVTEPWYVTTLAQIAELFNRGCFQDDPLGTVSEGATALFAQERGAMLAMGSYQMAAVTKQNPGIVQGLLAPITVPSDAAQWDGVYTSTFQLGVNVKSPRQQQAIAFLEFLTRPEVAGRYANATGQLVPLRGVDYTTPTTLAQTEWLGKRTIFQPRYELDSGQAVTAMQTSVQDVLAGMAPQEAAAKFQAAIDASRE